MKTPSKLLFCSLTLVGLLSVSDGGAWAQGDAKLLAAARTEGQFIVYTSQNTPFMEGLRARFEADVPEIKMQVLRAPSSDILAKFLAEREAGRALADVYVAWWDTVSTVVAKGYAAAYTPSGVEGNFDLRDPAGKWTAVAAYANVIGYNTNNVPRSGAPIGYMDLTQPKFRDKVGLVDPRIGGGAYATYFTIWKLHGLEFFTAIAKNKPFIQRQANGIVNAVAAGQIDAAISQESLFLEAKEKGAPIAVVHPAEGVSLTYWIATVVDNAPHPSAARVFLNWLVSEKGQNAIATAPNPIYPVRKGAKAPEGSPDLGTLKIHPLDLNEFAKQQDEITNKVSTALGLAN